MGDAPHPEVVAPEEQPEVVAPEEQPPAAAAGRRQSAASGMTAKQRFCKKGLEALAPMPTRTGPVV